MSYVWLQLSISASKKEGRESYARKIQLRNSNACMAWYSWQSVASSPVVPEQSTVKPSVADVVSAAAASQRTQRTPVTASSTRTQLEMALRRRRSMINLSPHDRQQGNEQERQYFTIYKAGRKIRT